MNSEQQLKRKNDNSNNNESCMPTLKRANTTPTSDEAMEYTHELPPQRPTTPPLGMTLSHYNSNTGTYTSSQLNSHHEVKSTICTGMTPVYRPPFERWGSCLI